MRALLLTALALLACAAPVGAAERVMPLSEVQKGMRCTGLSVVQGTEISSFDVEVLDVIAGDAASAAPRILIRVSGPAVDGTGLGPGFSGSPVICRDSEGRDAYAGAISEGIGEYGGKVGLATPMELVVAEPVDPPAGRMPPVRGARSLAGPLSIAGVSPRTGRFLTRLAARDDRLLIATAGRPRAHAFGVQPLRPGASMAAGLSSGDLTLGAVGTVAYTDGDRVWAFGHPFDAAGARSLFLQDAYVYTVVNNPVGVEGVSTYKLAAPGHDVGVISADGLSAVAGRLGVMPKHFPMRVIATDGDSGRHRDVQVEIADENHLGQPTGVSGLALVGAAATTEAATTALGAIPARQSGEMCATFNLVAEKSPLRFCNRYVMRDGGLGVALELGAGGPMVADLTEAIGLIDSFEFATLEMESVEVNLTLRRGLRQAYMLRVEGPRVVRRGSTARLRVRTKTVRGKRAWQTIRVPVPRGMPPGRRKLTLSGPDTDDAGLIEFDFVDVIFGGETDITGPRTVQQLREAVGDIGRYDGVRARFAPVGADDDGGRAERIARRAREVYRDPVMRLSGKVRLPVRVR